MPKMKSHSGAKKRFKTTGTGKLVRRQANLGHLNEHKSSRRIRRLQASEVATSADAKKMRKLLGKHKGR